MQIFRILTIFEVGGFLKVSDFTRLSNSVFKINFGQKNL